VAVIHALRAAEQTETVRRFHTDQEDEMSISISVAYVAEIERLRHDIERHIAIASELATEKIRREFARRGVVAGDFYDTEGG
jgi:biotin synthase-related radical SAM superfamily protein